MKRLFNLLYIFLFLAGCAKDAELISRDYPLVLTNVPQIEEDRASFSANILDLGNEEILEYGFVWGIHSLPTISNSHKAIKGKPGKGNYKVEVDHGLKKDQFYNLRAYIITKESIVYGTEVGFVSKGSNPPVITDFNPKTGRVGTNVVIEGENFSGDINSDSVKFGDVRVTIDSTFENRIYVHVTGVSESGLVNISVSSGGMIDTSKQQFEVFFPWEKKHIDVSLYEDVSSFVLNGVVYFLQSYNDKLLEYHISTNKWEEGATLPTDISSSDFYKVHVISDKAYFIIGNTIWLFNPASKSWTSKSSCPMKQLNWGHRRYSLCINGKIYLGYCEQIYEHWEYDPENDSWLRKADFFKKFDNPQMSIWEKYTFSVDGKGYLILTTYSPFDTFFCEYDPVLNSWSEKCHYPGKGYSDFGVFVLNGEGYVGLGSADAKKCEDLWKYNPQSDNWIRLLDSPKGLLPFESFVYENEAYFIVDDNDWNSRSSDMYIFDPSKN